MCSPGVKSLMSTTEAECTFVIQPIAPAAFATVVKLFSSDAKTTEPICVMVVRFPAESVTPWSVTPETSTPIVLRRLTDAIAETVVPVIESPVSPELVGVTRATPRNLRS